MLFASFSGHWYIDLLLFMAAGMWAWGKFIDKHDPEGKGKQIIKDGILKKLSKWLG